MNNSKPLILITNDDGITAKGIASIIQVARKFGEVVVVAPNKPQSGMGHAITMNEPLRLEKEFIFEGIEAYSCSGTPVDCVKLAIYEVLDRKPDLLLSGINHGANTSTNVLYSGTMSAAVEGSMENLPSIGFSLCDFDSDADFSVAKVVAQKIIAQVLGSKYPNHVCLNVNIPKIELSELKGIKVCKQAHAFWDDKFDKRIDQFGRTYYWMTGDFEQAKYEQDSDLYAIENGYASVVPTQFDMTAYSKMNEFNYLNQ